MSAVARQPGSATPRRALLRWLGWYSAANVPVLIAISLRNLAVSQPPEGGVARAFGVLMFVGHAAFIACLPAALLAPLILLWPRRRPLLLLGVLTAVLVSGTALVDTVIYQQYRFHLNAEIFNLLFGGAAGEILVFSPAMYGQAALLLLAIVGGQALVARLVWAGVCRGPARPAGPLVATLLVTAFVAQTAIHAWADVAGYTPVTRQGRVLLGYVPVTAEKLLGKLGFVSRRADAPLRARDTATSLNYPLRPLDCAGFPSRPNILFVVIDGWRWDALDPAVTPNIARLAQRSLRFTDHWSGGSATRTGIFSLFYGLPGTYWHAVLAEQRGPLFIDELLARGYEVSAFSSAKLINPEFDRTVFARVENLRLRSDGSRPSERDEDLTRDFLEFLERRSAERPFFGLLFYDAPHGYDVPDDFPQPFQPSWDRVDYLDLSPDFDPLPFHNRYLNCVHFDDALVGRVLEGLERKGLLEDTLILVTGDHGQEFNENGLNYWGHDGNFSRYQVAVPLVLYWPGREPAVHHHRTSHFDVVPTLLEELFACTNDPGEYGVGHHLLRAGGRELLLLANYTDYAVVQPDRIVAVYPHGVEILDPRYRPIPGATLDTGVALEALRLRSRFYR